MAVEDGEGLALEPVVIAVDEVGAGALVRLGHHAEHPDEVAAAERAEREQGEARGQRAASKAPR